MSEPYRPLSEIATIPVKTTSGPPEPPAKPFSGPPYEERTGNYTCKVPGCTKTGPFKGRHAVSIHLIRRHGLNLEGKQHRRGDKAKPAAPGAAAEPRNVYVNVRGILSGDQLALVAQAVRIVQTARENLSGKLSEMETLKQKAAKLESIVVCMKELLPDGGQGQPQQQNLGGPT